VLDVWSELPGLLISVAFATLFLGQRLPKPREAGRLAGPQLALGVTMGSGQYVVGLLLGIFVLAPFFGLDPVAGALIEIGFEGGQGPPPAWVTPSRSSASPRGPTWRSAWRRPGWSRA
jgi:glutamate:Na+ symporter, ESS family